jgi:hypothetical protein
MDSEKKRTLHLREKEKMSRKKKVANETQTCANGPPLRHRMLSARMTAVKEKKKIKIGKKEERLLTWSMTRITKCVNV